MSVTLHRLGADMSVTLHRLGADMSVTLIVFVSVSGWRRSSSDFLLVTSMTPRVGSGSSEFSTFVVIVLMTPGHTPFFRKTWPASTEKRCQ